MITITISGPAKSGKTRMALQITQLLTDEKKSVKLIDDDPRDYENPGDVHVLIRTAITNKSK